MSAIRKFIIEDVRCFKGRQEFDIRPLTFLVGENGTGKTTALGCFQVLNDYLRARPIGYNGVNFNLPPYRMGAFQDIVRKTRKTTKKQFKLGFELMIDGKESDVSLDLVERKDGSEPVVKRVSWVFEGGEEIAFDVRAPGPQSKRVGRLADALPGLDLYAGVGKKDRSVFTFKVDLYRHGKFWNSFHRFIDDPGYYQDTLRSKEAAQFNQLVGKVDFLRILEGEGEMVREVSSRGDDIDFTRSFPPVRSRPKRTYDPIKVEENFEDDDAIMILANYQIKSPKRWESMRKNLVEFGKASDLFEDIWIERFGEAMNSPFQLKVRVRGGPKVNLIDTGYGISQVLPLLVGIFDVRENTTFLMQEPEIHLHPKAQAQLTSLLVELTGANHFARKQQHSFVIETHSDGLIDRARIEIMRGNISPDDVSLIYLEPNQNGNVKVHNIKFDRQANMLGDPKSYGEFFLKESDRLLGFKD